jgi:hypothetical protein
MDDAENNIEKFDWLTPVLQVLESEIRWCHKNKMIGIVDPEFRRGFIEGVKAAKNLVIQVGIFLDDPIIQEYHKTDLEGK